jgi:excisionase family DNA binding protein
MGHRATGQQLLRISEAAEQLAVKESTIRGWLQARRISKVRVGRRAIRIPTSEVKRLISDGMVSGHPARPRMQSRHRLFIWTWSISGAFTSFVRGLLGPQRHDWEIYRWLAQSSYLLAVPVAVLAGAVASFVLTVYFRLRSRAKPH